MHKKVLLAVALALLVAVLYRRVCQRENLTMGDGWSSASARWGVFTTPTLLTKKVASEGNRALPSVTVITATGTVTQVIGGYTANAKGHSLYSLNANSTAGKSPVFVIRYAFKGTTKTYKFQTNNTEDGRVRFDKSNMVKMQVGTQVYLQLDNKTGAVLAVESLMKYRPLDPPPIWAPLY